jgi:hypothetical protein
MGGVYLKIGILCPIKKIVNLIQNSVHTIFISSNNIKNKPHIIINRKKKKSTIFVNISVISYNKKIGNSKPPTSNVGKKINLTVKIF